MALLRRAPLRGVLERSDALGRGYRFIGRESEDGLFDDAALWSGFIDNLVHAFKDPDESFHARVDLAPIRIAPDLEESDSESVIHSQKLRFGLLQLSVLKGYYVLDVRGVACVLLLRVCLRRLGCRRTAARHSPFDY